MRSLLSVVSFVGVTVARFDEAVAGGKWTPPPWCSRPSRSYSQRSALADTQNADDEGAWGLREL